jgi:hypothetical protein
MGERQSSRRTATRPPTNHTVASRLNVVTKLPIAKSVGSVALKNARISSAGASKAGSPPDDCMSAWPVSCSVSARMPATPVVRLMPPPPP